MLAGCLLTFGATATMADGHLEKAVKARQAIMQLYAYSLGQLGAMAKGEVEYNAEAATRAANNLKLANSIDGSTMWPKGTDNFEMEDKTRALPEIWTTYPAIGEKGKAAKMAIAAMAEAAGKDLASLQGAMGGVGGACGGCHKMFRAEKK